MFTTAFDKIDGKEILRLKENSIPEDKHIEYKDHINLDQLKDKKEFLADISSFANTNGGHIFWGISEESGIANEINGVDVSSIDELYQKIEAIIRDGLEPRINYELKFIELDSGRKVIIAYIYESWNKPHMVTLAGHGKFYARNNSGKYPLSVDELKTIIIHNQFLADKIRKFRFERIQNLILGETPIPCDGNGKLVLHIIPHQSFSNPVAKINISKLKDLKFSTLDYRNEFPRDKINIDGFLRYNYWGDHYNPYVQIYRSGIIECVSDALLRDNEKIIIDPKNFEISIKDNLPNLLEILKFNGFMPPIYLFLSLLGIQGSVYPMDKYKIKYSDPISRNELLLSESVISSYEDNILSVFKQTFDEIWNALGILESPNIDNQGKWNPQRK